MREFHRRIQIEALAGREQRLVESSRIVERYGELSVPEGIDRITCDAPLEEVELYHGRRDR
jgi:hypothetical protein